MSERDLITFASPTLASLKTGSLYSPSCESLPEAERFAALWDGQLSPRGVRVRLMRFRSGHALFYVYRPRKLSETLRDPESLL